MAGFALLTIFIGGAGCKMLAYSVLWIFCPLPTGRGTAGCGRRVCFFYFWGLVGVERAILCENASNLDTWFVPDSKIV